jgi:putative membrane protein
MFRVVVADDGDYHLILKTQTFSKLPEQLVSFPVFETTPFQKGKLMKVLAAVIVAASVFAAPALAQSTMEKTGVNSVIGKAPTMQDFVTEAAISDMFEINSSQAAQSKAQDANIKSFAAKMVEDHTKTTNDLKALVSGGNVKAQIPAAMDDSHKKKLDKLNGLNGKDFDKQYASDQKAAHKDAVSLFERYAKGGSNADLKAFASKYLPALKGHEKMANDLKP